MAKKEAKLKGKDKLAKINKENKAVKNAQAAKAKKHKTERFETLSMWAYYAAAMIAKDIGTIPPNIGNRILISSNMYTTKNYLNSVIQVTALGMRTPVTTFQVLNDYLRSKGCKAVVDVTFKRQPMLINTNDAGLRSRRRHWLAQLDSDSIPDNMKETAARCTYTCEQLDKGEKLAYTRVYLTIRSKSGTELMNAEKLVGSWLVSIGASYLPVTSTIKQTLEYMSLISDKYSNEVKDVKALVTSDLTLAQMMPNCGAFNGEKGLYVGMDIRSNTHFNLNLEKITVARNIYIIAPSGVGKTVLAQNIVMSALEHDNWRVFINDIKGNEWMNTCMSVNGLVLSLTPLSRQYINSFKMNPDHTTFEDSEEYFKDNFNLSKLTMITLTGATNPDVIEQLDTLVEQFLNSVYSTLGVLSSNKNTWYKTMSLTPYIIYDMLVDYMTPTMIKKFDKCGELIISSLRKTMSVDGSKSYIFKEEFDMFDVYKAKCVVANFGMLKYSSISTIDAPIFKLKFEYAQRIKAAYVQYNYNNKFETLVIDEESQIVPPETMHTYIEDFTLRRAQRQTTVLLGNSIQALLDSTISKPLIENVRGLLIGDLPQEARDEVIKQFDLKQYEDLIMTVGSTEQYQNSFVFINRMEPEPVVPIIKFILDGDKARRYLAFSPSKDMSGNS